MDPAASRYLTDLVAAARQVLGGWLIGAYAAGSLGLDAYQPERSDIDVALLVADALDDRRKHELVARLRHEALPCPARGLELVVYRRDAAASGTAEPGFEVELNTGPAMAFRATYTAADRAPADGRFWYGLDRSILHQKGRALLGPPAGEMFADLSAADLSALLVAALEWWLSRTAPESVVGPVVGDAVLGACRSLVKVRHGTWLSKVDAGRRLVDTGYQPADLIQRAIIARLAGVGSSAPCVAEARAFQHQARVVQQQARAFQQQVLDEIRQVHDGPRR